MESAEVRIHLGCGSKRRDGWINVDLPGVGADVECDITERLPFPDNHADAVEAIHVFEHIALPMAGAVLTDWVRVLKPGGRLVLELPCRDKVFAFIAKGITDPRLTMWPLYGDPKTMRSEADIHKWCWSKAELAFVMQQAGLTNIESTVPQYHVPERDMRLIGVKGGD